MAKEQENDKINKIEQILQKATNVGDPIAGKKRNFHFKQTSFQLKNESGDIFTFQPFQGKK